MAKKKEPAEMSVEELETLLGQLREEKQAIRERLIEVTAVYDRRVAERSAVEKLASMTDAEKEALAQIIKPASIIPED